MSEPGTDLPSETKTFETDIKTKTSPQSASPRR